MIAGHITATTSTLARVKELRGKVHLYDQHVFQNGDFSEFESVLGLYLRRIKCGPTEVVMGVAGPVLRSEVRTTNLPWHIRAHDLESKHDIPRVKLVNDLAAAAHGLFFLSDDNFYTLNPGVSGRQGNIGLMAAGHGLGQAIIFFDGTRYRPFASEGGHSGFAPSNQLETELWEYIYAEKGFVEVEDILSVSGLERLYRFAAERDRQSIADWFKKADDKVDAIIEMALSDQDVTAVRAIDLFIDCYATEAANLGLKGMTLGGIHLAGLMAPRLLTLLDQGRFMTRFAKKGKMEVLLNEIPVKVVLDDQVALLGAAAMAISHRR